MPPRELTFAEKLDAERQAVAAGASTGCQHVCPWEPVLACERAAHTDAEPHAGRDGGGIYRQWVEPPVNATGP